MIKNIIDAFRKARQFQLSMSILQKSIEKQKMYKVKLTKEQMNLLYANYFFGIKNVNDLEKITGFKLPKL